MPRRLTGLGECMIELSQAGEGLYRRGFAGDVVNTLYYARRALPDGWSVRFHTGVGDDGDSDDMAAFLGGAGIHIDTALRVPGRRPGLYMIHLDGAERSFSYWRDTSAARALASDGAALAAGLDASQMIYLSGITLAILPDADRGTLFDALATARAGGARIAFDPNIRPRLWPDPEVMRDAITRCAALSDIVLPSFEDEATHFGDADPDATAARYATAPGQIIVVKNGDGPTLLHADGARTMVPTAPVTPVDTTGAGDSFNGGFLANYLETGDAAQAIAAGQAVSAEVIQAHGALI